MRDKINMFITAETALRKAFGCPGDYYLKPSLDCSWRVLANDDLYFLTRINNGASSNAVVVKQGDKPMVYRAEGFTLVVAIDCVKIAFLLDNQLELTA